MMARRTHPLHRYGDKHTMALFMRDRVLTGEASNLDFTTVPDGFDAVRVPTFVADERGPIEVDGVRGRFDEQSVQVPRLRIVTVAFDERPRPGGTSGGVINPRARTGRE